MSLKKIEQTILIIIDSIDRELLGFLKLKKELEIKNYRVEFCNKQNFKSSFNYYKPKVIFCGQIWKTPGLLQSKKGSKIFFLRAESCSGLLDYINEIYKTISEVIPDYFCCWGPQELKFLRKKIRNTKLILTGHPVNELVKKKKKKKKIIIGIATTVRQITSISRQNILYDLNALKQNKEYKNSNPFVNIGSDISALYGYEINFLSKLLDIVNNLKKKYEIVLRHHPLEDGKIYNYFKRENIEIDKSIFFNEFCSKIDVLLCYKSSIQIYAYNQKVKVINLEKFLDKDNLRKLNANVINMPFDKFFPQPKNLIELRNEINRPFKKILAADYFLKNIFNINNDKKSSDLILNELKNIDFEKIKFKKIKDEKISNFFVINFIYKLTPSFLKFHFIDVKRYLQYIFFHKEKEIFYTYSFINRSKINKMKKIIEKF